MWKEHFSNLLSQKTTNINKHRDIVINKIKNVNYCEEMTITTSEIQHTIESLKNGKARGPDGLCAEHFKFAGKRLHILLSCSSHGFIPDTFMKSIIIPLIKDKAGDITDTNNYRSLALSTISSKIYERIILNRYDDLLTTTDNQFGFKKGYSTDMCIYRATPQTCVYIGLLHRHVYI